MNSRLKFQHHSVNHLSKIPEKPEGGQPPPALHVLGLENLQ